MLAVGVTAAWAGYPNFRQADSTFDAGTATKPGKRTLAKVLRVSAVPAFSPATLFVRFEATEVTEATTFVPFATGTQTWACANWGGGWPADPKKVEGPVSVAGSQGSLTPDENGEIVYTGNELTISFAPPAGFACPNGQTALLVRLSLTELVLQVVGEFHSQPVDYPTSASWVGNVYSRADYPG